jgi:hypothetical protein
MFRDALTALSNLSVTGVGTNYDIDAVPDAINRGQLPVLLVLPVETNDGHYLFQERGEGFETLAFSSGVKTVNYAVTHLLLVAPATSGSGLQSHLPDLIDLIDDYFAALAVTVTLGGELLEPAQVRVEPGIFAYGGVDYVGCAFRHKWSIGVGS